MRPSGINAMASAGVCTAAYDAAAAHPPTSTAPVSLRSIANPAAKCQCQVHERRHEGNGHGDHYVQEHIGRAPPLRKDPRIDDIQNLTTAAGGALDLAYAG